MRKVLAVVLVLGVVGAIIYAMKNKQDHAGSLDPAGLGAVPASPSTPSESSTAVAS